MGVEVKKVLFKSLSNFIRARSLGRVEVEFLNCLIQSSRKSTKVIRISEFGLQHLVPQFFWPDSKIWLSGYMSSMLLENLALYAALTDQLEE